MDSARVASRCAGCDADWSNIADQNQPTDGKRQSFERILNHTGTLEAPHDPLITVATGIAAAAGRRLGIPNAFVPLEGVDFLTESLDALFKKACEEGIQRSAYGLFKCIVHRRIQSALRRGRGDDGDDAGGVEIRPIHPGDPAPADETPLEDYERPQVLDFWNTVAAAVQKLPTAVRRVAKPYLLEHRDAEAIAELLNMRIGTVRVNILRVRERMKKLLPEDFKGWELTEPS